MITIAIDLGGTIIKAGLLSESRLEDSFTEKAASGKGLKNNLPLIEHMVARLMERHHISAKEVMGIGFSSPGLVDSINNRILSINKKYDDAPELDLPKWAKETWGLPLYLENDARMALLGEWQHGAGKGCENIVMVTMGTGIGTAVLTEGRLMRGKHFQGGNLGGHFTVNYEGAICTCGNIGCMESEASTWRLPDLIKNHKDFSSSSLKSEEVPDYEILFKHAAQNDTLAREILDRCYAVWSSGLISMIHAFDPEIIIMSGGIINSAAVILPELQERINRFAWTPWGKVKLLKAQHINTAALYGADYLVRTSELKPDGK
jgi:glucokinase